MCLTETPDGIMLEDIMFYAMPLGWLGQLFNTLLIDHKLERIFDTRRDYLDSQWGLNR